MNSNLKIRVSDILYEINLLTNIILLIFINKILNKYNKLKEVLRYFFSRA